MKIKDLLAELAAYSPDDEITSLKLSVKTARTTSKLTFSKPRLPRKTGDNGNG